MNNSDRESDGDRLKDLGQRLDETVAARQRQEEIDVTDGMAAGFAFRAIAELMVALGVCTFAGYWLDRYFGTTPWMMIILMPLGQAAGIWNIMRMGNTKQAEAIMGGPGGGNSPTPAAVKDDEDED
jgi:ATP synthase protein I